MGSFVGPDGSLFVLVDLSGKGWAKGGSGLAEDLEAVGGGAGGGGPAWGNSPEMWLLAGDRNDAGTDGPGSTPVGKFGGNGV